ncbi:MAG: hypothetical protein MUC65_07845, partial [Pontiellaceae bacterium]|nr:hypothetical protein [Pontiellaceae bacterium]
MKRKKTRPAQKTQRITYSTVRALIPLDTAKLRKTELGALNRIKTTHAKLTDQLTQFEKKDVPEFQRWIHKHGSSIRDQLQAESTAAFSLQNIFFLADDLCGFYRNRTGRECVEAAQHYIETKGDIPKGFEDFFAPPPPAPEDDDDDFDPFGGGEKKEGEEEQDETFAEFRRFMDSILNGEINEENASFFHQAHSNNPFKLSFSEKLEQEKKTLKKLYRNIVQKLHPDRAGSSTPEQQELWHAAKRAYTLGDIQTLRLIDSQCDLTHKDGLKSAAISSIRTGILFYKRANEKIRYEMSIKDQAIDFKQLEHDRRLSFTEKILFSTAGFLLLSLLGAIVTI